MDSVRSWSGDKVVDAYVGGTQRTIGSYESYADAERAVDQLSNRGFAVERVAIVGRDLRYVEQVTGRVGTLDAAVRGAVTGAVAGALVGWLFGVFSWVEPIETGLALALYGLALGALIGGVLGLVMHLLAGGRRDFSSVSGMQAGRYDVVADEPHAAEAERVLRLAPRG
jgi:uncharacterized protein YcfJ